MWHPSDFQPPCPFSKSKSHWAATASAPCAIRRSVTFTGMWCVSTFTPSGENGRRSIFLNRQTRACAQQAHARVDLVQCILGGKQGGLLVLKTKVRICSFLRCQMLTPARSNRGSCTTHLSWWGSRGSPPSAFCHHQPVLWNCLWLGKASHCGRQWVGAYRETHLWAWLLASALVRRGMEGVGWMLPRWYSAKALWKTKRCLMNKDYVRPPYSNHLPVYILYIYCTYIYIKCTYPKLKSSNHVSLKGNIWTTQNRIVSNKEQCRKKK